VKDFPKQYESILTIITKVVVQINDLHGGIIKLGGICHPNFPTQLSHFSLFLDNLITYGSEYVDFKNPYSLMALRD